MSPAATRLWDLLDKERLAAIAADVDAVVCVQEDKRSALEAFHASYPDREEVELLAEVAHANLVLLRHLAECFRGLAGLEGQSVYGAGGQSVQLGSRGRRHGAL